MEDKMIKVIEDVLDELGLEHSLVDEGRSIRMVVPNSLQNGRYTDIVDSEAEISAEGGKCVVSAVNKGCRFNPYDFEDRAVEGEGLDILNNKGLLLQYVKKPTMMQKMTISWKQREVWKCL